MLHRVLHQSRLNGSLIELRECLDAGYERCLQIAIYEKDTMKERFISPAEWHAMIESITKEGSAQENYDKEIENAKD